MSSQSIPTDIFVDSSYHALIENPQPLMKALAPWFLTRRWSGMKGLRIEGINVVDWTLLEWTSSSALFASLVEVMLGQKEKARIFYVPLQMKLGIAEDDWTTVKCMSGRLNIREAELSKEYNETLLRGIGKSLELNAGRGRLVFASLEKTLEIAGVRATMVLGQGDTTNILVKIETESGSIVAKTYKNVTEGNPEPEMLVALATAGFRNVPKIIGELAYFRHERRLVLGILQGFVNTIGDGSLPFEISLKRELGVEEISSDLRSDCQPAQRLGGIIASMHHALGNSAREGFGAHKITEEDMDGWKTRTEGLLQDFLKEATEEDGPDESISGLISELASRKKKILEAFADMGKMWGMKKIRTHQDLHLAQLLTVDRAGMDFLVVDFEGDPQRTGETRRELECPLRDLGTMARSFSYLRYNMLEELLRKEGCTDGQQIVASYDLRQLCVVPEQIHVTRVLRNRLSIAKKWEVKMRRTLVEGYLEEAERLGDSFLSSSGKIGYDLAVSVTGAWEIEKAILEARYELHHRPQKLTIPVAGLLTLCA